MQLDKLSDFEVHYVGKYIPNSKKDRKNPITLQYDPSYNKDLHRVGSILIWTDGKGKVAVDLCDLGPHGYHHRALDKDTGNTIKKCFL